MQCRCLISHRECPAIFNGDDKGIQIRMSEFMLPVTGSYARPAMPPISDMFPKKIEGTWLK